MLFPATGCLVQDLIGAKRAWAFDVSAACSGFVYALTVGAQFVETGRHQKVMVIGADVMTSILDYKDRTTCVLFGDGAGAVILEPREDGTGILDFAHEVDGSGACYLNMPAGGSLRPATHETVERGCTTSGSRASTSSSTRCASSPTPARRLLQRNGLTGSDVDLFVAHQANIRIIEAAQQRMGLPDSKVIKNIREYGNTTAATIPLALKTALDEKRLAPGHRVLLAAVGAGFTVGTVLLQLVGSEPGTSRRRRTRARPCARSAPGTAHGAPRARWSSRRAPGRACPCRGSPSTIMSTSFSAAWRMISADGLPCATSSLTTTPFCRASSASLASSALA